MSKNHLLSELKYSKSNVRGLGVVTGKRVHGKSRGLERLRFGERYLTRSEFLE
jgi:hypothetical protein